MNRVVQGHAVAVRDRSQGKPRDRFLEDSSILDKSFGKIDPENMSGAAATTSPSLTRSWSARQIDLFNGERRFIFGVKD